MSKYRLLLMLLLVGVSTAVGASAAEPQRVVVLSGPDTELTRIHLAAELRSLGFEVVASEGSANGEQAIVDASRTHQAVAIMELGEPDGPIRVWIVNEDGEPALAEVVHPESASTEDRRTAVLRSIERLRASLLKSGVRLPRKAAPQPEQQTKPARSEEPSERDHLLLNVGAGAINSRGGVGTTGHAVLALRWMVTENVGVRGFGMLPVLNATIEGPEGSASFSPALAGGGISYSLGSWGRTTSTVEGGTAAVFVDTEGNGGDRYQGRHDATVVALPYVGFGIETPVSGSWSVGAELLAGTSLPRATVYYADREAAVWGSLVFAGSVSVGFAVF